MFTHPQIDSVGLTEKAARDLGYEVVVGKALFEEVAIGNIIDEGRRIR